MSEKKYRWPTPFAWFNDKMHEWESHELRNALHLLGASVDQGVIRELFQDKMTADGFSEPLVQMQCPKGSDKCHWAATEGCPHSAVHNRVADCREGSTRHYLCPPCTRVDG